jgi:RNA polymerase sigma factor (sigma-70 family)
VVVSPDVTITPFETFLEDNRRPVMRFLLAAVGPVHADDVFQETFLAALRAYPRVLDEGRLDRWVLRIASRKAIDHHRRTARGPIPVEAVPEGQVDGIAPPDDALWGAVAALPPRQRVAVVHRFVFDRAYAEIGELMGSSEQTARANVSQGVRRLREQGWTD